MIVVVILAIIIVIILILYGMGQMDEAKVKNDTAKDKINDAKNRFFSAKDKLDKQKDNTMNQLSILGNTNLNVLSNEVPEFIRLSSALTHTSFKKVIIRDAEKELTLFSQNNLSPKMMNSISQNAIAVMKAGGAGVGAGALACLGVYGSVNALGYASTGTAIATLTGVAETNAVLAWLGGGSLATGGLGIVGGQLVLGGVFIGTSVAVAGKMMNIQADKNLEEAARVTEEVRKEIIKMDKLEDFLYELEITSSKYHEIMTRYIYLYQKFLNDFETVITDNIKLQEKMLLNRLRKFFNFDVKVNYKKVMESDQLMLDSGYNMTMVLSSLIKAPILNKAGEINQESVMLMEEAKKLIVKWE